MSNGGHATSVASSSLHESTQGAVLALNASVQPPNNNDHSSAKKLSDSSKVPTASLQQKNMVVSLVHKVFGGKLQTTYQCSNCKSISLHKEAFTDLHLAFPGPTQDQENATQLTMQELVNNYLTTETLQGMQLSSGLTWVSP